MPLLLMSGFTGQPLIGILFVMLVYCMVHLQFLRMCRIRQKIIERCLLTNPKALSAYGPDGGYPEGFHYWGYGTSFQVLLIAALESALGTDAGLSEYPGFWNQLALWNL